MARNTRHLIRTGMAGFCVLALWFGTPSMSNELGTNALAAKSGVGERGQDDIRQSKGHHLGSIRDQARATIVSIEAYTLDPNIANWYQARGAGLPLNDRPAYCHGYGCELQTPIPISSADLATIGHLFAGHTANAVEERKAISLAVSWWERHASPLLGGPPREHGSDIAHAHHRGATDCIDEATNSTTILIVLERHGFLKFHRVERPVSRGMIVNAHSTAIIREIGGDEWAVDMWMHNMGEAPDIMPETQWFSQA